MKSKTNPFCSAATLAAKNPTHRSVMKTTTPSMKTSHRILTTSIAMLLGAASAHAATYYWDTDGSGTPGFGTASGTWGTSTFWGTDSAGSGATANTTITTADDVNFGTASAGLGAGTITGPAAAQGFLNMTFGSASGAIALSGGTLNLDTATGSTITVNNASDSISTVLQGAGGILTKAGTGTLTLSGTNTYTGGTAINAGQIAISSGNNLGSGTVTFSGGTLGLTANLTLSNAISVGAGGGTIDGSLYSAGQARLTGAITGSGALTIIGGTSEGPYLRMENSSLSGFTGALTVASGYALFQSTGGTNGNSGAAYTVNAAGLILDYDDPPGNSTFLMGSLAGSGNIYADGYSRGNGTTKTLSVGGLNTDTTFGGVLADNIGGGTTVVLSLIKTGSGTQTLSGANTYSGNTTVTGGTLKLDQVNSNNESSTVSIAATAGAKLDLAFVGTDTVDKLYINGVQQPIGDYTSANTPSAFTGGGTLHVTAGPAGFAGWITGTFANGTVPGGQQGAADDPDLDGVNNLMEYAIAGLDPTVSNGAIGTFTGNTLSYTKRQPLAADLTYVIETSPNLQTWTPQVTQTPSNTDATISYLLPTGQGKLFGRLRVEQQP